jgi:hypothetical protein
MGSAKWLVDAVAQRQKRCKGHMRQQLFDNAQTFEIAVNEALAPYQVKFLLCQSLSEMVRESPLFQEA